MTSKHKILLYGSIGFVICIGLILITAYGNGVDPFAPETRHIWLISIVAALYASFRGVHIYTKIRRSSQRAQDGSSRGGIMLLKREHDIDKRMAARRQRVAAAKARQAAKDSGEE